MTSHQKGFTTIQSAILVDVPFTILDKHTKVLLSMFFIMFRPRGFPFDLAVKVASDAAVLRVSQRSDTCARRVGVSMSSY
jgi:hypothetical protein